MIALNKTAIASLLCLAAATAIAGTSPFTLLNDPVDISGDFRALENFYYLADKVSEFDPATHAGKAVYQRAQYRVRHAFDNDLSLITA
ncbi:MAG: alpha-xylosidase, partial [Verrucomicrobiota bacterium]